MLEIIFMITGGCIGLVLGITIGIAFAKDFYDK